jgi:hypothetical protein
MPAAIDEVFSLLFAVEDSISLAGDKTASAGLFEGRGELKGD